MPTIEFRFLFEYSPSRIYRTSHAHPKYNDNKSLPVKLGGSPRRKGAEVNEAESKKPRRTGSGDLVSLKKPSGAFIHTKVVTSRAQPSHTLEDSIALDIYSTCWMVVTFFTRQTLLSSLHHFSSSCGICCIT